MDKPVSKVRANLHKYNIKTYAGLGSEVVR